MVHESVHQLIKPIFLVLFERNEIMLMVYETLVGVTERMFRVHEVHKISVHSFRRSRKLSQISLAKKEFVYHG
jgi:hypothetical protein